MAAPVATLTSGAEVRLALRQRTEIGLLDVRVCPFAFVHTYVGGGVLLRGLE